MSEPIYKRGLKKMNKYQQKILILSFLPSTLMCLCVSALLYVFFADFGNALMDKKTILDVAYAKHWGLIVVGGLWLFFFCLIVWAYREAHHLVGAFDRVKKELHNVSTDQRREKIIVREKDHLFAELLENINVIIKKLYDRS